MKKVVLIYGGESSEHDISCKSAKEIMSNIDINKYILSCVYVTKNNEWIYNNSNIDNIIEFLKQFDVVFNIIHGNTGEDGKIQGMLDLFNIKYIGTKCGSSYICMDKERTKQILNYYKIPQVPFQNSENKLIIPFPVIVKPANGGSSIGINIANNKKEYKKALKQALKYDKKVIVEKYIKARELECAILEEKKLIISDVGEIITNNKFYDYDTKYVKNEAKTVISDIPDNIKKQIKKYAKKVFKVLELKGLARIDFFYDEENNKIYLNEINTLPGFTKISMYPKLLNKINYKDLITKLIENI